MTRLMTTKLIHRPAKEVWSILADVGAISTWNPNITRSYILPGKASGPGAARHCDVRGGWFEEKVSSWHENESLGFEVMRMSAPIRAMTGTFHLRERPEGTEVDFVIDYEMKMGLLGRALDKFVMQPQFARGLPRVLEGLKREAEAAES